MWEEVVNFIFTFLGYVGDFWSWATTPLLFGQNWLTPLSIIGGGGFVIIIGAWLYRLFHI